VSRGRGKRNFNGPGGGGFGKKSDKERGKTLILRQQKNKKKNEKKKKRSGKGGAIELARRITAARGKKGKTPEEGGQLLLPIFRSNKEGN